MAKTHYTKEEREAQFVKTGVQLAKKVGLAKVSAAAIAAKHDVTGPLVFHIFGNKEALHKAIAKSAKAQGIVLTPPKAAPVKVKKPITAKQVQAIKRKATPISAKQAATKKAAAPKKRPAVKVAAPKTPAAKAVVKKFTTVAPPSVEVPNAEPKASV